MARSNSDRDAVGAHDDQRQHHIHGSATEEDLDVRYPNRPKNHSKTLPFHDLYLTLFNPLNDCRKHHHGPVLSRKKRGPHGPVILSPYEMRRTIIEKFISRWRKEVGDDIYPAFRLIIPEKDRYRALYGLKEKTIGRLLVQILKINKDSVDGNNLLNWKLPGTKYNSTMTGDFAGRCYEVISKRPMRTTPGDMTIDEVNEMLDRLSAAQKDETQLLILQDLYKRMNAEEMMWLIRIILKQMKVGASERTIFNIWHPDAESLFSISSSLRRVCWELYDTRIRLRGEERGISLMQCFQPQLAAFQMHSFEKMVSELRLTEDDNVFWIEEKLDGERMQLHMIKDDDHPGGYRLKFWSRKAKDYTYLYGNGFEDENSALTRHLKGAFNGRVKNIILDGEMITWDPEQDAISPFGTLKTAAISEQRNPYANGLRPLFRVFDCLYLNDKAITGYSLRDRHRALEASIEPIHRRLEIHPYLEASTTAQIELSLRQVVAESSEGLILKNPRSMYKLNDRNSDWIKVKPEYMTEYGENLDCLVIGGYYGSGRRGGRISSLLCGLRAERKSGENIAKQTKFVSFVKVGGGMTAADYAAISHHTNGKWKNWDVKAPPTSYIELAGGERQFERPDMWIKPDDSIVISVKAASVSQSDQFRTGYTLRFPRFKKIRHDKDWKTALSTEEFLKLKQNVEEKEKTFQVEDRRKKRQTRITKKTLTAAGNDNMIKKPYEGSRSSVFHGLTFYIMSEAIHPERKPKAEIERTVKMNGGTIAQSHNISRKVICISDRNLVKVAALIKSQKQNVLRSSWIHDCIAQHEVDSGRPRLLLPPEPSHMFHVLDSSLAAIEANIDSHGDSYVRNLSLDEFHKVIDEMPSTMDNRFEDVNETNQLDDFKIDGSELYTSMFRGLVLYIARNSSSMDSNLDGIYHNPKEPSHSEPDYEIIENIIRFADGSINLDWHNDDVTHIVCPNTSISSKKKSEIARRPRLPWLVSYQWVLQSWTEKTLIDEERFAI